MRINARYISFWWKFPSICHRHREIFSFTGILYNSHSLKVMRSEISLHLKKRNVSRDKIHETHMSIYYKHICGVKWLLWWRRSNLYIILLKKMKYPLSSTTTGKIRSFTYNLDHSLQILMPFEGISYTKLWYVYNW